MGQRKCYNTPQAFLSAVRPTIFSRQKGDAMLAPVTRKWWVLLLRGLCAIALGVIAIMWPGITLVWLVALFATFSLIDGVASIVLGVRGEPDGTIWWTMILLGVVAIAAAIAAFSWPGLTLIVLLNIIAAFAIVRGVFEIVAAIKLRQHIDDEWVLGLSGALSILFGVLLIARPGPGLLAIALLVGFYMLLIGSFEVALALRLRKLQYRMAGHGAAA
jgi:uncharacterized membrane protein HdeD (DUF308 family)